MRITSLLVTSVLMAFTACGSQTYSPPVTPHSDSAVQFSTPGAQDTEVLAEGVAALTSTEDIARDNAIDDALRKAVEQGVGTFISSETQVSNFQLIDDNIYSTSRGYVSSYRIIDEGMEGGVYSVVVRAMVKQEDIENDLAAIGLLLSEQGRPRVMVLVREIHAGQSLSEADLSATMFETMVMDHFRDKGFPVVDGETVQRILEADQLRLILEGDDRTAALIGLQAGAEIVVSGSAMRSSEMRLVAGTEREIHRYMVSSRAVNAETGALMAASAITVELPFSESQARAMAADSTAVNLTRSILEGWTQNQNTTEIIALDADFERVQDLRSRIRNTVRGVSDVVIRDLIGNRASLDVLSETSTEEIIDALSGMDDLLMITSFSGNRVQIRLK